MKREFDIHRDIWGPQVTFMLHILSTAFDEHSDASDPLGIKFPSTIGNLPKKFKKKVISLPMMVLFTVPLEMKVNR